MDYSQPALGSIRGGGHPSTPPSHQPQRLWILQSSNPPLRTQPWIKTVLKIRHRHSEATLQFLVPPRHLRLHRSHVTFLTAPPSRKRPSSSLERTDKPEAKQRAIAGEQPKDNSALKVFLMALKQAGPERTKLMNTIPGSQYYRFRGLYLEHKHGNLADL